MVLKNALQGTFAAAILAVLLSGCGGGDGGGPASVPEPPVAMPEEPMGIPEAARNAPVAGESVVQSSTGGDDPPPVDISARVTWRDGGEVDYRVARGSHWFLDSTDDGTETLINRRARSAASGLTVTAVVAFKGRGRETGASAGVLTDGIGLAFHTDMDGPADADYLVWGSWTEVPETAEAQQDIRQGAFATGSDPFGTERLAAITGAASYRGDVRGVYFAPEGTAFGGYSFQALVNLEADFGDGTVPGSIGGKIENFIFQVSDQGGFVSRPAAAVTLGSAPIGIAHGGLFAGGTSGTYYDGTALSGRWGGRFYGNAEDSGFPGSTAGTFGATDEDGERGFIGAFGGLRQTGVQGGD